MKCTPVEIRTQQQGVTQGHAAGSSASTIDLQSPGTYPTDDIYNGMLVSIVDGTGHGQTRYISDYNGTLRHATVTPDWDTSPDTTSVWVLWPGNADLHNAEIAQPGQEAPSASQTLAKILTYLYKGWRNKWDNDGSTSQLYNDDASTVDQKQTTSYSGSTVTKGEIATGP